nr:MAG TPA: hypothetical protein [Bacteriophage sp.]
MELAKSEIRAVDLLDDFKESVNKLTESLTQITNSESVKFGDKVDHIMNGMIALVPVLLNELNPENIKIDEAKSNQVMRVNSLLQSIQNSLYKKREIEIKEEVDVTHPKFQKVIEFIVDGALQSLQNINVHPDTQAAFIHDFSLRMVGFEDTMNKKLKGLSFQDLDTVTNPLIKQFNEERKA